MTHSSPQNSFRAALRSRGGHRGFTAVEMLLVIVMIGILSVVIIPMVSRLTAREKVSDAAALVQHDLERAFSTAARLRKAVVITADNSARIYRVLDASDNTVRISRNLGASQDASVTSMTFSPATVTVQPNGVASSALTVTLVSGDATREVDMSRVGLIRRNQ